MIPFLILIVISIGIIIIMADCSINSPKRTYSNANSSGSTVKTVLLILGIVLLVSILSVYAVIAAFCSFCDSCLAECHSIGALG